MVYIGRMFRGRRIAVVVPCLDEADKVARTIRSVPGFVDAVLVVDDGSRDGTARVARKTGRRGLEVIVHGENRGVGAAIASGYARALELGADVIAVMAGDAQMDPLDLPRLLAPVVTGAADYAKGDRFLHPECRRVMPATRRFGNRVLSQLTRLGTGLSVHDSQCGYTAASRWAVSVVSPNLLLRLLARCAAERALRGVRALAGRERDVRAAALPAPFEPG